MKTFVAALGLAALVSSQASLPPCAQTCAINAIGNTGCAITDAACICTKPDYLTESQTCIQGACDAADQQAALEFAVNFCAGAGITLSVDTAAPASTPAPESSAAATTEAAPTTTEAAPTTTEAASSAPAPSGPPVSQISDGQPQATTGAPATFTGAAMPLQKNIAGGLGALALGVVAAL